MHNSARERGASLVEYALLLVLIALVAAGAVQALGGDLASGFTQFAGMFGGD